MAAALDDATSIVVADSPALDAPAVTIEATVNVRALGRRMTVLEVPGQYGPYVMPDGMVRCGGVAGAFPQTTTAVTPGRWTRITCASDRRRAHLAHRPWPALTLLTLLTLPRDGPPGCLTPRTCTSSP